MGQLGNESVTDVSKIDQSKDTHGKQDTQLQESYFPSPPSTSISVDQFDDPVPALPAVVDVEPPSPIIPHLSVAQKKMPKYSSSTSIASEEDEEARTFESHFETMSEEADSILSIWSRPLTQSQSQDHRNYRRNTQ